MSVHGDIGRIAPLKHYDVIVSVLSRDSVDDMLDGFNNQTICKLYSSCTCLLEYVESNVSNLKLLQLG